MNAVKYDSEITALLLIDPYNDFISEGVMCGRASGLRSIASKASRLRH
jgi:hypothetical protein